MALANSSLQSHITFDSTSALFRSPKEIDKDKQTQIAEQLPRIFQKYQNTQIDSLLSSLPEELQWLTLSMCAKDGSSDALLKFGLTSKYWHLRVRNFIETDPQGQIHKRAHEHHRFVVRHGKSPAEAAKEAIEKDMENECPVVIDLSELKSSSAPVVVSQSIRTALMSTDWWPKVTEALAYRKTCVTVLDAWNKSDLSQIFIPAIHATPAGSYIALRYSSLNLSDQEAESLAIAMKERPVVCLVVDIKSRLLLTPESCYSNLLIACAKHQVEGTLFRFQVHDFIKIDAKRLVDALQKFKTAVSLEIQAVVTTQESMKIFIEGVRSINRASPAKVNITFDVYEVVPAVVAAQFENLAQDGIHFMSRPDSIDESSSNNVSSDDDLPSSFQTISSELDSDADNESSVEES